MNTIITGSFVGANNQQVSFKFLLNDIRKIVKNPTLSEQQATTCADHLATCVNDNVTSDVVELVPENFNAKFDDVEQFLVVSYSN